MVLWQDKNLVFLCIKHNYKVQKQTHSITMVLKFHEGKYLRRGLIIIFKTLRNTGLHAALNGP